MFVEAALGLGWEPDVKQRYLKQLAEYDFYFTHILCEHLQRKIFIFLFYSINQS